MQQYSSTIGSFGRQALCGGFIPDTEAIAADRGYFGLEPEGIYLYGTFRTSDGAMHTAARRLPFGSSRADTGAGAERLALGRRLAVQTNRGSTDGHQHLDVATLKSSASGASMDVARGRDAVTFVAGAEQSRGMLVEVSDTELHWREDGVLDLAGTLVGAGLQWYVPGRDTGMLYTSQIFEVSGTIYGEKVTGFVPFDPVYMAAGAVLYAEKDVLEGEELCLSWYTWGTRWDDGAVEVGHTLLGHDRFGVCIATDASGITVRSTDVEAEFDWNADEYHVERVAFDVAGEPWEFVADPHGWQPDLGPVPNPQQEGIMRRVGERRSPVHWSSWGEANRAYAPPRRNRYKW